MKIPQISKTSLVAYFLFFVSFCILAGTSYFVFSLDVLKDWKLTLPAGNIHVGDTIVLESSYIKERSVSGTATRYIVCENKKGVNIRYELNQKTADRKQGKGGTGVDITIRRDIPDLPATCKFAIGIEYPVLPFKKVHEYNETKEFTLLPERTTPVEHSSSESQGAVQTTPIQGSSSQSVRSNASSSSNNTPNSVPAQQDNSQNPPSEPPRPGIVQQLNTTVENTLRSVDEAVRRIL